jgi:flagella basal body P-ring formation protein FlgA
MPPRECTRFFAIQQNEATAPRAVATPLLRLTLQVRQLRCPINLSSGRGIGQARGRSVHLTHPPTTEVIAMNNPRPVMSIRKTVQLMVILTILAWATQTLFAQWGLGGLILPEPSSLQRRQQPESSAPSPHGSAPAAAPQAAPAPRPAAIDRFNGGAMVEVQPRARFGDAAVSARGRITLRDVCKWSDHDAAILEPLGDVLIAKLGQTPRVRQITVDDIKSRLHDAGVNLSQLQFTGAARCAILIGNAQENEADIEIPAAPAPGDESPGLAGDAADTQAAAVADAPVDEQAPPEFFDEQLVLTRPLSRNQRIIASDLAVKRVKLDGPSTRPGIEKEQIVGNLAARDLKAGEVFDLDDIARPAAVTRGQFMTVALRVGQFDVETVARAMDTAARGEICRAKNEANGDVYRVLITADNEGRAIADSTDVAVVSPN